ncbi:ferredoxin/adrenodoxin reductase [Pluteus cervinus]|uniref:Ferredoxin/adrenodoxin reductase n=1 Tax=Pluteus cervinus TaxID=181527 RepID=A0ACD3AQV4_9AGAR|nr:ferredoxin/adrenodoxin reductase [Pluteus cervinus]
MTLKLAIIGGGPSAFYVASRILSAQNVGKAADAIRVHVYDRHWAPHGLVRYGVAPDHPEVKNCTHKFDNTAQDPRFRFFGNVNVGTSVNPISSTSNLHLPLASLLEHYTHILFATGCTLPKLHPSLSPSSHCIPALSVVHWYTAHPSNPPAPPITSASHVSLIGNGNVSLDVARILLTPVSTLAKYDVPDPVLEVLAQSKVKHVSIIGRRGPVGAAFTTKELRELINLSNASMVPLDKEVLSSASNTPSLTRQQSRILKVLQDGSKKRYGETERTWSLDFFRSPTGLSSPTPISPQCTLSLAHTMLDPNNHNRAIPTGEVSALETSLVITSLGFQGDPLTALPSASSSAGSPTSSVLSLYDPSLGHLRTLSNRVVTPSGQTIPNVYASGWAAVGARGVLATTMMDAYGAADTILEDWVDGSKGSLGDPPTNRNADLQSVPPIIQESIAGQSSGRVVLYDQWKKIDEAETWMGAEAGKERERMTWSEVECFLYGKQESQ